MARGGLGPYQRASKQQLGTLPMSRTSSWVGFVDEFGAWILGPTQLRTARYQGKTSAARPLPHGCYLDATQRMLLPGCYLCHRRRPRPRPGCAEGNIRPELLEAWCHCSARQKDATSRCKR